MNKNKKDKINSFSDQIIFDYIQNQNITDNKDVTNFIKVLAGNDYTQYYLDNFDAFVSKYEPNTYTMNLKRDSIICNKICMAKFILDFYGIRVDVALKAIEAFINGPYINTKTITKLPTKYISNRVGLSQKKVNAVFDLCGYLKLAKIEKDEKYNLYVKFTNEALNDPWIKAKKDYFKLANNKAFAKAYHIDETLYHYGVERKTFNKNIRREIIEIILAFNHIIDTDPVLRNQYYINGNRTDIIYAICPTEFISFMLGVSIHKIKKELNKLFTKTDFISPHDKVYIDSFGKQHYTNPEYKYFNMQKVNENTILEEGHPIVNEYSIIWHEENLEKCKYYKHFKNNKNNILEKVSLGMILYTFKNYINIDNNTLLKETDLDNEIIKEDINKYQEYKINPFNDKDNDICAEIVYSGNGSLITIDDLKTIESDKGPKPYLSNAEQLNKMSIPKLINVFKKTWDSIVNCGINALKYLIRQKDYIIRLLQEKIYNYSRDINYKQALRWKQEIEYLTSNQNENSSILYEFVPISLYIKKKDDIKEMLDSIRI